MIFAGNARIYIIIARKIFFPNFRGHVPPCPLPWLDPPMFHRALPWNPLGDFRFVPDHLCPPYRQAVTTLLIKDCRVYFSFKLSSILLGKRKKRFETKFMTEIWFI